LTTASSSQTGSVPIRRNPIRRNANPNSNPNPNPNPKPHPKP